MTGGRGADRRCLPAARWEGGLRPPRTHNRTRRAATSSLRKSVPGCRLLTRRACRPSSTSQVRGEEGGRKGTARDMSRGGGERGAIGTMCPEMLMIRPPCRVQLRIPRRVRRRALRVLVISIHPRGLPGSTKPRAAQRPLPDAHCFHAAVQCTRSAPASLGTSFSSHWQQKFKAHA